MRVCVREILNIVNILLCCVIVLSALSSFLMENIAIQILSIIIINDGDGGDAMVIVMVIVRVRVMIVRVMMVMVRMMMRIVP